jgi:hypothetical protein
MPPPTAALSALIIFTDEENGHTDTTMFLDERKGPSDMLSLNMVLLTYCGLEF